ncbi:MAG: hypothetical protein V2A76_16435 [Planctomycetota bacterium]
MPSLLSTIGIAFLLSGPLAAQEVRTLVPERYRLAAGGSLLLTLEAESLGARSECEWPGERIAWLFVRVAGTQENLEQVTSNEAGEGAISRYRIGVEQAGIALLGVDLKPRVVTLDAHSFDRFLGTRVGLKPKAPSSPPGEGATVRVRRIESAKLLLQSLDEHGQLRNSADAQSKSGQQAEIRPLADPTAVGLDRDLPVRVYLPGASGEAIPVIATHVETGRRHRFLTGQGGTGHFTVDRAGVWVVEAHSARPLTGDPEADWELSTATLRFEVPPLVETAEEDER